MFKLNKISQTVDASAELSINELERQANQEGLTTGYWPIAGASLSLGECVKKRVRNFYAIKYGGLEELCIGGQFHLQSSDEILNIVPYPRAATGPDWRRVLIGSKNQLGYFVRVSLRLFPIPEVQAWGVALFKTPRLARQFVVDFTAQFIRPRALAWFNEKKDSPFLASLHLDNHQDCTVVCFELAGLKKMVQAEKDVLQEVCQKSLGTIVWPISRKETMAIEKQVLTPEAFESFLKWMDPVFGPIVSGENVSAFEIENFKLKKR